MASKYSRQPGDSILALLEPGEYVLNRNAVDEIGKENLDELNFEDSPRFNMAQRSEMQLGGMLGESLGMQGGGSMEYGGATTEPPNFEALYEKMNMQPNFSRVEDFETQYAYDPEREGIHMEDYSRSISDSTKTGQQKLLSQGQAMAQQSAKSGFAGSGGAQAAAGAGRDTIMDDFLSQQASAQSSLFKGIQSERDTWMREAGQGLGKLSEAEGTMDYGENAFDLSNIEEVDTLPASGQQGDLVSYQGSTWAWVPAPLREWREVG